MSIQRYIDALDARGIRCVEHIHAYNSDWDCFADFVLLEHAGKFCVERVCRGESSGYGDELPKPWKPIQGYVEESVKEMEWTAEHQAREAFAPGDDWEVVTN